MKGADPARTLALLWRHAAAPAPRRGPRPGLSVDAVVERAIQLADADGIDAVTMRGLASGLGVAPMTLYAYVPGGKAELLDLMLDAVLARMPATASTRGRGSDRAFAHWRDRLEAVAHGNRALYAAHPWAATLSPARPPLGPGLMTKYERELSALEGCGLDDVEMDAALTFLLGFVQASARATAEAAATRRRSGVDDEAWWSATGPVLARVLDPAAYPTAARVGSAAGAAQGAAYDAEAAYAFGLARVLDGLGALIEARAGPRAQPGSPAGSSDSAA